MKSFAKYFVAQVFWLLVAMVILIGTAWLFSCNEEPSTGIPVPLGCPGNDGFVPRDPGTAIPCPAQLTIEQDGGTDK